MFSIGFTDEPLEHPYDDTSIPAAPGTLVLGKSTEEFWLTCLYGANRTTSLIGHVN
jgi:hypothetical protein